MLSSYIINFFLLDIIIAIAYFVIDFEDLITKDFYNNNKDSNSIIVKGFYNVINSGDSNNSEDSSSSNEGGSGDKDISIS